MTRMPKTPKPKRQPQPQPPQVQLPQLNIELANTGIRVVPTNEPDVKAIIVGPVLVNFILPLSSEAAKEIQGALGSGLVIAPASALTEIITP